MAEIMDQAYSVHEDDIYLLDLSGLKDPLDL